MQNCENFVYESTQLIRIDFIVDRFRQWETQLINAVQRIPGLTSAALTLHYALQASMLVVMGACLYLSRWQQAHINIIAQAATTNLAIVHFLKLFFKHPRQDCDQAVMQAGLQRGKMQGIVVQIISIRRILLTATWCQQDKIWQLML